MENKNKRVKLTVRLTSADKDKLLSIAKEKDICISNLIRQALEQLLTLYHQEEELGIRIQLTDEEEAYLKSLGSPYRDTKQVADTLFHSYLKKEMESEDKTLNNYE